MPFRRRHTKPAFECPGEGTRFGIAQQVGELSYPKRFDTSIGQKGDRYVPSVWNLKGKPITLKKPVLSMSESLFQHAQNREVFCSLKEAEILIERWRREYNHIRPHSSLNYQPPAPEVIYPKEQITTFENPA